MSNMNIVMLDTCLSRISECIQKEGRKETRKVVREGGRNEGRKDGRKE